MTTKELRWACQVSSPNDLPRRGELPEPPLCVGERCERSLVRGHQDAVGASTDAYASRQLYIEPMAWSICPSCVQYTLAADAICERYSIDVRAAV